MKNSILMLAGAAALSLASCTQEKATDTTVTAGDGTTTTTTTTTTSMAPMSEADIEARAQRIADKMVADMKITDEATKTKIRTVYVNRYKKINEVRTKYTTDTTGMAAAMRDANAATDQEFHTVFTDPTQYQAYESTRSTYYDMDDDDMAMSSSSDMNSGSDMSSSTSGSDMSGNASSSSNSGTDMSGATGKMKMDDGSKMKVKADGDVKLKDAAGNKAKMAGDDGTVKMKPEDGGKSKIK